MQYHIALQQRTTHVLRPFATAKDRQHQIFKMHFFFDINTSKIENKNKILITKMKKNGALKSLFDLAK